jgi:integrase
MPQNIHAPAVRPAGRQPTMADLVARYRASRLYPSAAASVRNYEWAIARILEWTAQGGAPGALPLSAIGRRACNEFYEALLATGRTAAAGQIMRVLNIVLEHGVTEEFFEVSPARKLRINGTPPRGIAFPRAALAAFVATADALGYPGIATAMAINHWLGQRPVDIVKLPRNRYRDGTFWIFQQKTRAYIPVPHSPAVAARVEAELRRQAEAGQAATTLLVDLAGRPYAASTFGNHFVAVRDAVASEYGRFALDTATVDPATGEDRLSIDAAALQFRDLRPTAVTELATAGCALPQIAAISGHSLAAVTAIVDRYLVRSGALAAAAADRRLAWEKTLENKP